MRYAIPLAESISRSPEDWRGEEKPWLFETLAHNLPREAGGGAIFYFFTRNSLKTLDPEKKMKRNESKFTSV